MQRKKMALEAISRNVALPSDSEVLTALVAGCSLPVAEPEEAPGEESEEKAGKRSSASPMRHTEEDEN